MLETAGVDELKDALTTARAALAAVAKVDLPGADRDALCEVALEAEGLRRQVDAAQGPALAELHERDVTQGSYALRTSRWLGREAKLPAGVARTRVVTAARLREHLPEVADAQRDGRIGFDHARVFADVVNERNVDALAGAVERFIEAAEHMSFGRWRPDVEAFAALMDADGCHDPADDILRNKLTLSHSDGFGLLRGEMTEELAVFADSVINARADELYHRFKAQKDLFPDTKVPPRVTLRMLALDELLHQATGVDLSSTRGPVTDVSIVVHADHAPGDPANPPETALRGPVVTTLDGRRVSRSLSELLCCDARSRILTATPSGKVWDQTDAHDPNRAQRRATRHRDGGCTFPGCGVPAQWCDVHHVIRYPNGKTVTINLATLCRMHHRCVHRHGWTVTLTADGWTIWTSPAGATRWGQRHGVTRAGPLPTAA